MTRIKHIISCADSPNLLFALVLSIPFLLGFAWGYFFGHVNGVNNTMIEAWQQGVAVPTLEKGEIKYRWVDPHLLEEIPPPLPE
jgi:hypothetical protein